jgi:hypothetical protein
MSRGVVQRALATQNLAVAIVSWTLQAPQADRGQLRVVGYSNVTTILMSGILTTTLSATNRVGLHIQIPHFERMLLDELAAGFDVISH